MEAMTAVQHPLGRNARVEEVASVVLFLASQAASFITGGLLFCTPPCLSLTPLSPSLGPQPPFRPPACSPDLAIQQQLYCLTLYILT